jgi:hypothetical protein
MAAMMSTAQRKRLEAITMAAIVFAIGFQTCAGWFNAMLPV